MDNNEGAVGYGDEENPPFWRIAQDKRPTEDDYKRLRPKQRLFVEYFKGVAQGSATKAASLAGYANPGVTGYQLLRQGHIRRIIGEAVQDLAMEADEILSRTASIARADFGDFAGCFVPYPILDKDGEVVGEGYRFDLRKAKARGLSFLVKTIKPTAHGDQVELHDAQRALETLAKIAGLLDREQRIRITVEKEEEIRAKIASPSTTMEELEEMKSRLLALPSPKK